MMQSDYFLRYIDRKWHGDFTKPLVCDQYTATLVERLDRWAILSVTYATGITCFFSVMLKPERWMNMDKNAASVPTDDFTGYTYNIDGPFGYRSDSVESAKERIYSLCEGLRPVVAPAPAIVVAPIEVVAAEVVVPAKKKRSSYQCLSATQKRERARLRRLERFRCAAP